MARFLGSQIQESAFSSLSSDADVSNAILAHFGLLPEGPEPPKPGTLLAGALPSGAVPLQPQSPEHAAALLAFLELCSQVRNVRDSLLLQCSLKMCRPFWRGFPALPHRFRSTCTYVCLLYTSPSPRD